MSKEEVKSSKELGKANDTAPTVMDDLHKSRPVRRKLDIKKKKASVSDKKSCIYCHDTIERHEGHAWCLHCKIAMHKDCAEETVSCPTLGCKKDLLNYTPLSLKQNAGKGLSVFGFSLGQVLYYYPLLVGLTGVLMLNPENVGFIAFLYATVFILDWALGFRQILDGIIDRFNSRHMKLFSVVIPLLVLSFISLFLFTGTYDDRLLIPVHNLGMAVAYLFGAFMTLIAQIVELENLNARATLDAVSTKIVEEVRVDPVPSDLIENQEQCDEFHEAPRTEDSTAETQKITEG